MSTKFCKDCKWFGLDGFDEAMCSRPLGKKLDLVYGNVEDKFLYGKCSAERSGPLWDTCSALGLFWEAKEQ